MRSQILGIKTTTPEPSVLPENAVTQPESVKPIPKDKGGLSGGFGKKQRKSKTASRPCQVPTKSRIETMKLKALCRM